MEPLSIELGVTRAVTAEGTVTEAVVVMVTEDVVSSYMSGGKEGVFTRRFT